MLEHGFRLLNETRKKKQATDMNTNVGKIAGKYIYDVNHHRFVYRNLKTKIVVLSLRIIDLYQLV